jgi:hypothetical protein
MPRLALLLLALSPAMAAAARPPASRCHLTLEMGTPKPHEGLAPLPPHSLDDDVAYVNLPESFPQRLSQGEPFEAWLVVAGAQKHRTLFAQGYRLLQVTPLGTFALFIFPGTLATRIPPPERGQPPAQERGLLAYLCFDPKWEGALEHPLPPILEEARSAKLLTARQQQLLAPLDKGLEERFQRLRSSWENFRKATDDMRARTSLLEKLVTLYDIPRGPNLSEKALEPSRFLDGRQRAQLRKLGHSIEGHCQVWMSRAGITLELRHCPRHQLVNTWNRRLFDALPDVTGPDSWLQAAEDQQHEELELAVQVPGPLKQAVDTARRKLLAIKGLQPFSYSSLRSSEPSDPKAPGMGPVPQPLGPSDIMTVVLQDKPAIVKCANEQKKRAPKETGKLVMRWLIQPTGVTAAVTCRGEEFCSTYMAHCINILIQSWKFPRNEGPAFPVLFPFVF